MRYSLTFCTQSVETTTTRTQQQPRRIYLAAKREKEKKSGKQYNRLMHSSVWAILISEMWSGEYIKKEGRKELASYSRTFNYKSHACSTSTIRLESRHDADVRVSTKANVKTVCDWKASTSSIRRSCAYQRQNATAPRGRGSIPTWTDSFTSF